MNTTTILIDIDDVMNNLCEEWCNWLNEKYGCNVTYQQVTEWDMSKFFPQLAKDQVYEPLHNAALWDRLKPKPGAVEYIKRLIDDGHKVFLCTSTDYRNVQAKFERVIQRYFPYIRWSQVIVTSCKQMINADILIDDGVHNLEGGDYIKILMTAPHNKKYDEEANEMLRADNWEDAYNHIVKINCLHKLIF